MLHSHISFINERHYIAKKKISGDVTRRSTALYNVEVHYHSVQNLLSASLIFRNSNIKIYRTIILLVVLYGCENWSLTLM